jgi:hypothetical protein
VNCSQSSRSPRIADASSNSWSSSGSLRFGANIGFLITAAFISPSNADNKKYRDAKATRSAPGSRCQTSANRIDRPFDALGVHRAHAERRFTFVAAPDARVARFTGSSVTS